MLAIALGLHLQYRRQLLALLPLLRFVTVPSDRIGAVNG